MLSIPTPNANRWWLLGSRVGAGGPERAIGDDVIRYRPFFVTRLCRISQLAIKTNGVGHDNTIRMGIYNSNDDGLPGTLLGQTPDISTDGDASGTVETAAITPAMTTDLLVGRMYYAAIIQRRDGAAVNDTNFLVTTIGSASGALTLGGVSEDEALDNSNDFASIDHAAVGWSVMPTTADMTSPTFSNMPPAIAGEVGAAYPGEGPGHAPFVYPWGNAGTDRRWYVAGGINRNTQVFALTAGAIAYVPFFVSEGCVVDRMAFEVTTADAGGLLHLGIFSSAADGTPGNILMETGPISTAATGVKDTALTAPLTLTGKTTYWAAMGVSGGTPSVRMLSQSSGQPMITNLGSNSAANATSNALRDAHMAGVGFLSATGFINESGATYTMLHMRQIAFRVSTV